MLTPTQRFAAHIVARFQPVRDRVNTLLAEYPTPEARAAALVESIYSVECSISEFAEAWRGHWAYTAFAETMPHLYTQTPDYDPYAVAVWRHDAPGRAGREYSYMIGQISTLIDPINVRWGEKNLGAFAFMRSIEHNDEPHPTRVQSVVYAVKRRAAYTDLSRRILRRWLPKSLHRLIIDVRRKHGWRKQQYVCDGRDAQMGTPLTSEHVNAIYHNPRLGPDWFTSRTKAELWALFLPDADRALLSHYIDPIAFYNVVICKYHPDQVTDLINAETRMRTMPMF